MLGLSPHPPAAESPDELEQGEAMADPKPIPGDPGDGELEELLAGYPDAAYVRLYRITETGERPYLARLSLDVAREGPEAVRSQFGGGKYLAQVCKRGGGILGQRYFQVAGAPRDPDEPAAPPGGAPLGPSTSWAPHVPPPAGSLPEMVLLLRQTLDELRRPPPAAAAVDPTAMALNIVQTIQAQTAPLNELIVELRKGSGGDRGVDVLEAFTSGMKAAARLSRGGGGGGGGGSHWDRLIDEVLVPVLNRAQNPPAAPLAGHPPHPNGRVGDWRSEVQAFVGQTLPLAQRGSSPELYARVFLDQLPDGMLEPMMDELERKGSAWWDDWFQAFPETRPHEAWYRQFVGALWMPDEGDQDDDDEGEGGA